MSAGLGDEKARRSEHVGPPNDALVIDEEPFVIDASTVDPELLSASHREILEGLEETLAESYAGESEARQRLSEHTEETQGALSDFLKMVVGRLWMMLPERERKLAPRAPEHADGEPSEAERRAQKLWQRIDRWLQEKWQCKRIVCLGKPFDPSSHKPISRSGQENAIVVEVLEPGFYDVERDCVVKYARVQLGQDWEGHDQDKPEG